MILRLLAAIEAAALRVAVLAHALRTPGPVARSLAEREFYDACAAARAAGVLHVPPRSAPN